MIPSFGSEQSMAASSWSRLPLEILDLILNKLPLPDCFTFANVCPSWRSVFLDRRRLTRPPPCMVLRPYRASPDTGLLWSLHGNQLLKLRSPMLNFHRKEQIVGSSMGWLVIVYNPFVSITQTQHMCYIPSLHLLNPVSNERIPLPGYQGTLYHVAMSTDPRSEDCVLVLSGCTNDCTIDFEWCRLGDSKWTSLHLGWTLWTGDDGGEMMFYNGKLYVLRGKEKFHIFAFDPQPKKIGGGSFASISENKSWFKKRMVQSGVDLFLIGWRLHEGSNSLDRDQNVVDVFKQAEDTNRWVRVENLGDKVFLIGERCGGHVQSLSTKDLMGSSFEPNCIYFPQRRNEKLEKFLVEDGSNQRIQIPLTDKENAFLAAVEWIVPQTWSRSIPPGSLADSNFPHISFWMPPPVDYVKVNFDAEIDKDSACATYGIVMRNHLGHVVICKFGRCLAVDVSSAEGSALLFGMKLAGLLNLVRVMFECDNEMLITWLNFDEAQPPHSARGIIESCRELAAKFEKCSFSYIRREGNEAAHRLTLLARSNQCPHADSDVTCLVAPDGISDIICADLAKVGSDAADENEVSGENFSNSDDGENFSNSDDGENFSNSDDDWICFE